MQAKGDIRSSSYLDSVLRVILSIELVQIIGQVKRRGAHQKLKTSYCRDVLAPHCRSGLPHGLTGRQDSFGRITTSSILSPMAKSRSNKPFLPPGEVGLALKRRKAVPHEFVLDAIAGLSPMTRSMFGCVAVYVEDKIVLILRDKRDETADDGVWLATTKEHHESLRREFPNMRSIQILGKAVTGWQVLPSDATDFEEAALRACELIVSRDPRIGKVPASRRRSGGAGKTGKSAKRATVSKRATRERS